MRHRTASAEMGIRRPITEYITESVPCYYCSPTEGEPELHPTKVTSHSTTSTSHSAPSQNAVASYMSQEAVPPTVRPAPDVAKQNILNWCEEA